MSRLRGLDSDDGWRMCFVDYPTTVSLSYAVSFLTVDGVEFSIEGRFTLVMPDGAEVELDPQGEPKDLAPILSLVRRSLQSATMYTEGRLEIEFEGDFRVIVGSSQDYEAWSFSGPDEPLIVALPGGGISRWEPSRE